MTTSTSRSLRLHRPDGEERKIGWLELFYDLIYVATIIQLGDLLARDATPRGALLFVCLFVPVWWSWTGMMFYFNRFVADDSWHRVLVFAQMLAIAHLGISVTGVIGETSAAFALAYFAIRTILVAFYARAYRAVSAARPLIGRYAVGFSLAAGVWLLSAFVPPPYRFALWGLGLAVEFYVTLSAGSRRLQHLLPPDPPHFAERYGLFTIIVLGESFIKVVGGLAGASVGVDALVLSGLGLALAACVWWLYFDHTHVAVLRSTPTARYVWIYGHLPLTVGITALGVGLKQLTLLPLAEPASDSARWLVGGAVALCLAALAALDSVGAGARRRDVRSAVAARLAAAGLVVAITGFGTGAPAGLFALVIVLTCVALVAHLARAAPAGRHP